jgi:hypothetical protein
MVVIVKTIEKNKKIKLIKLYTKLSVLFIFILISKSQYSHKITKK